jgi:hypothetical protein
MSPMIRMPDALKVAADLRTASSPSDRSFLPDRAVEAPRGAEGLLLRRTIELGRVKATSRDRQLPWVGGTGDFALIRS